MLTHLQIENYALIERADIEFGPGFNVLTGETGSGKSIIVDALGLVLGERAEAGAVRSGAEMAAVTGSFSTPFASPQAAAAWSVGHGLSDLEGELRLRREIAAGGRSRAFIGHGLASLALLRELAAEMGEIHSQHESLAAFTPAAQLRLLDRFAETGPELETVTAGFQAWREAAERLRDRDARERLRLQQVDLWRFQAEEIAAVHPQAGEDAALENERRVLANTEKIAAAAAAAYAALYDAPSAAATQIKTALRSVGDWQRYDASAAALVPRLQGLVAEAVDIAEQIRSAAAHVEAAPGRLDQVEERCAALDRLRRKYGPTLDDVIRHRQELEVKLAQAADESASQADDEARCEVAAAAYRQMAAALSRKRRAAAPRLAKRIVTETADLAMTVKFQVGFEPAGAADSDPKAWGETGWDRIQFLASTNPGEPLLPVAGIASGGELSRLLLALHVIAPGRKENKTLVLDEIDAGIGGRAAEAVGRKMQQLGQHYQVLCVTHLAQIATFASHHLHVEKSGVGGRTVTRVRRLEGEERISEVARMLAGERVNTTALRHAEELIAAHAANA